MSTRIDKLNIAFQGDLSPHVAEVLSRAIWDAANAHSTVSVQVGGLYFELGHKSRDGWWTLRNADVSIEIDAKASERWRVVVRPDAIFLMKVGPRFAIQYSREIAATVIRQVENERVRRVDLAADIAGFDVKALDIDAWVGRPRTTVMSIGTIAEYAKAGQRTGFVAGKTAVVFRAYDKIEELSLIRNDGPKRDLVYADWRRRGWKKREGVTRCEFQLRGDVLKELDDGRFRDPDVLLEELNSLWEYCTSWISLRVIARDERRTRWAEHAWWKVVRQARFNDNEAFNPRRVRRRSHAQPRLAVAFSMSYAAAAGVLYPINEGRPWVVVGRMSESAAATFVHEHLNRMMGATAKAAATDLISAYGPRGAALNLVEKQNAVYARFASSIEKVAERLAFIESSRAQVAK